METNNFFILTEQLILKCQEGDLTAVKKLIFLGANEKINNYEPLKWAVMNGHLDIVEYFSNMDINFNICFENNILLRLAAKNGHFDIVKFLSLKGANIHANNYEALISSAKNGSLDIFKFLVERGADINVNNFEAMYQASKKEHKHIVQYILEKTDNKLGNQLIAGIFGDEETKKFINEEIEKEEREVVKRLPPSGLTQEQRDTFKSMLEKLKKEKTENNRDNYGKRRNNNVIIRNR